DTRILEVTAQKPQYATMMYVGRLRITEQVTGYDRIETRTGKVLERTPLDLPPMVFETQGIWFDVPSRTTDAARTAQVHVMGGLHAMEHAAIGIFPLLVLADRNDLGGISTPCHPQLASAAIFIYDGLPGGAGICTQAFAEGKQLLDATLAAIAGCPCESGCPSCVHSPKCGSGNRPIDKAGAVFLLKSLMNQRPARIVGPFRQLSTPDRPGGGPTVPEGRPAGDKNRAYGVLDLETQLSAAEVGGWHRAHRMRVSCAVLYDSQADAYYEFVEGQVPKLLDHLGRLPLVVGFNIKRFD
ncbi:MAG TPA: Zn-binding domain-containing protein, partial [Desulfosarcina sp.]|nr:Zn-binding domain-containing protein [Desulfosarcina sp.]